MFRTPSHAAEAPPRRVSNPSSKLLPRVMIALLVTAVDGYVVGRFLPDGLRDSAGKPVLRELLLAAVGTLVLSLFHVWCETMRFGPLVNRRSPANFAVKGVSHDTQPR